MNALSHPPKLNTRIPPILLARRHSKTTATEQSSRFAHIVSLSKQKLRHETSTNDPDLRRCVGHHKILRRSVEETHKEMERYLDDVLESESDDECGSENDEEAEEACLRAHETKMVSSRARAQAPYETSGCMREKIVGVVRGLVHSRPRRRSLSASPPHPAATTASIVPIAGTIRRHNSGGGDPNKHPLIPVSEKNSSCSDIPIGIHVHVHITKEDLLGFEGSQSHPQTQSITVRGRKYARRLGFRRRCSPAMAAVPVAT
jgi:hypothetical protein